MSKIIGDNRRSMAHEDFARMDYRAVLVQGENNDVVCYLGSGSEEFVRDHGDKLLLEEAEIHFPWLRQELKDRGMTYRR